LGFVLVISLARGVNESIFYLLKFLCRTIHSCGKTGLKKIENKPVFSFTIYAQKKRKIGEKKFGGN